MKILILIISNDHHPFDQLQTYNWDRFMKINTDIDCYYLKEKPELETNYKLDGNNLYLKMTPHYYISIYQKTIEALSILKYQEYDFIIRTNMSSFLIKDRLVKYLEKLPRIGVYAGCKSYYTDKFQIFSPEVYQQTGNISLANKIFQVNKPIPFASGACFIITPDIAKILVENIVNNKQQIIMAPDDVLVGYLLEDIDIISPERLEINEPTDMEQDIKNMSETCFHIRVKVDRDRNDEKIVHTYLYKTFYNYIDDN